MNHRLYLILAAMLPAMLWGQSLTASRATLDLGQVTFNRPITVNYEVTNKSRHPLQIVKAMMSCGCTTVSYPQQAIAAGEKFDVSVTYDARQLGHFHKQVALFNQTDKKPLTLTLQGVVVAQVVDYAGDYPCTIGQLKTDKDAIEFDDVNKGDRPFVKFHIFNPTSQTVEPQLMHLPRYLTAEVSPSRIAPNRSGVVTVSLDSRYLPDYGLSQTEIFLGLYPGDKVSASKAIEVSAVLLPRFDNLNATALAYAPKMRLSGTEVDFRDFQGKRKKKAEIEISNEGRTSLEIRSLQMSSSGLEISLSDKVIEPGAKSRLKITGYERELRKSRTKPRILMITNDPEHAKVVVKVKLK